MNYNSAPGRIFCFLFPQPLHNRLPGCLPVGDERNQSPEQCKDRRDDEKRHRREMVSEEPEYIAECIGGKWRRRDGQKKREADGAQRQQFALCNEHLF